MKIMKKLLMVLFVMLCFGGAVACADTYAHDDSVLPTAAKTVIKKNFKSTVSVVKIDKDFGMVSEYEVVLTDGTEINFDSKGNWKEVEVGYNAAVPAAFIPQGVSNFIKANQQGTRVVGIEKKRGGYDVKLSNGVEMKFNSAGQFIKYDD